MTASRTGPPSSIVVSGWPVRRSADVAHGRIKETRKRRCRGYHVVRGDADAGGDLAQDEPVGPDVEQGKVGDDPVDAGLLGQRKRALLDDLGRAVGHGGR